MFNRNEIKKDRERFVNAQYGLVDGGFSCTFIKSMNYRSYPVYLISPEMCVY